MYMGGFLFMMFRLVLFRLGPLILLRFCKDRQKIRLVSSLLLLCYGICLLLAGWNLFGRERWMGAIYLPVAMFPHYVFYFFALWMVLRCVWSAWSLRVWKRIYTLSVLCVILGILAENYWNPKVLQFFLETLNIF